MRKKQKVLLLLGLEPRFPPGTMYEYNIRVVKLQKNTYISVTITHTNALFFSFLKMIPAVFSENAQDNDSPTVITLTTQPAVAKYYSPFVENLLLGARAGSTLRKGCAHKILDHLVSETEEVIKD